MSQPQSQNIIEGLLSRKYETPDAANSAINESGLANHGSANGRACLLGYIIGNRETVSYDDFKETTCKSMDCRPSAFEQHRRGVEVLFRMVTGNPLNWQQFHITRNGKRGRGHAGLSDSGKAGLAALAAFMGAPAPIPSVIDPPKAPAGSGQPHRGKGKK